jgi:hypothetical protein
MERLEVKVEATQRNKCANESQPWRNEEGH